MRNVLLITTGGTIASVKTEFGLSPALNGKKLLEYISDFSDKLNISIVDAFCKDSSDMVIDDILSIYRIITNQINSFDAIVITHGSDTISYTAALLYHMLDSINIPVVLTASILPIGDHATDAIDNIELAFKVCLSDYIGVCVVAHNYIIGGHCVTKINSCSIPCFASIEHELDGELAANGELYIYKTAQSGCALKKYEVIDTNVFVLKLVPALSPSIFPLLSIYKNIIIESYGLSSIPTHFEKPLAELIHNGCRIFLKSQCVFGISDIDTYEVGTRARRMGIICINSTLENTIAMILCGKI